MSTASGLASAERHRPPACRICNGPESPVIIESARANHRAGSADRWNKASGTRTAPRHEPHDHHLHRSRRPGARALLGLPRVPAAAARGDRRDPRAPRQRARAADRRRQVALLPGAGAGRRWHGGSAAGARRLAADRADEGPGRRPGRERRARGVPEQRAVGRGAQRRGVDGARAARAACCTSRPSGWSATAARAFASWLGRVRRAVHRDRRGALHQPVGTRLQARVPPARAPQHDFPGRRLHAFTATATARVRDDIVAQLGLRDPSCSSAPSTGRTSRIACCRARQMRQQLQEVLGRHRGEAGIIYCLVAPRGRRDWRPGCRAWVCARCRTTPGSSDDDAPREPGGVPRRARRRRRGDRGVRHGHRPLERAVRGARRRAAIARALPAGVRPRRPRRPAGRMRARSPRRPTSCAGGACSRRTTS